MATAVADGINFMNEVIATPQPATHFRCSEDLGGGLEDVTYYTSGFLDYDPIRDPTTAIGPEGESCDITQSGIDAHLEIWSEFDRDLHYSLALQVEFVDFFIPNDARLPAIDAQAL